MDRSAHEVLAVARGVLSDLDLAAVLERVVEAARSLTGAQYAALGVLDSTRSELSQFITSGLDDLQRRAIGPLPRGRGVLGELIRHPTPLRLADVGAHPHSYGFPMGHPPMTSFLGVPIVVAGQPFGNLYLTDKVGAEEFSEDDQAALCLLADFAGVAIDHARRYSGSEAQRAELERTVGALDATIQIARALGGQTDLDVILQLVAKRGRALVSARAVVIEHHREGELVIAAAVGDVPEGLVGQRLDPENSVASAAMRTAHTQRLEDEPTRARFERHGLGRLGFHAQAGLVVPLVFRGQSYGVLVAVDRLEGGPGFTAEDRRLLEAFAASAATAVAAAESVAAERRRQRLAAAEQERARWARELHDETLQGLAAVRLGLAAALRAMDPEDRVAGAVGDAVTQLEAEIAGLRSLITELRPAALDQLGLHAAVVALAERARRDGLDVDVNVELRHDEADDDAARLIPDLEIAVYRIVQEALTNARKHGAASRAVVEVVEEHTAVRIHVRDDGQGFDPGARTDGFGLLGMQERAELLEGTLRIESAPDRGSRVTAVFPARHRGAMEGLQTTVP